MQQLSIHMVLAIVAPIVCFAGPTWPRNTSRRAKPASFRVPRMWQYTAPLLSPEKRAIEPSHAQKDPTVVYYAGKWHVFMTAKLPRRSAIEYCTFDDWKNANKAPRILLRVSDSNYYCAPEVF